MKYTIYELEFQTGVHFGDAALDNTEYTFCADTLFSALCSEAVNMSEGTLDTLLDYVHKDKLILSDAFPYMNGEYYIPKPVMHISNDTNGDSTIKKKYKKLQYIPVSEIDNYVNGRFDIKKYEGLDIGEAVTKVSASVRGLEDTMPYRVGVFYYKKKCGVYIIVGYDEDSIKNFTEMLLESLSYSGIGGKRSSGLGRFTFHSKKLPAELSERLGHCDNKCMTLSVALPKENEIEYAMDGATYIINKRSGFVASETYSDTYMRKKDLYVFKSGACFTHMFNGDVYDVSCGGRHPVYRYAKPFFMEV